MALAQTRSGGAVFLHRVGGVAADGDRRLLRRSPGDDFWSLPGGRVQIGETAAEALRREMAEEIHVAVDVGRMTFVVENYFVDHADDAVAGAEPLVRHEIGLYHEMTLPERLTGTDGFHGLELSGTRDEHAVEFRWFPVDEITALDLRPAVLAPHLAMPIPAEVTALVQRG